MYHFQKLLQYTYSSSKDFLYLTHYHHQHLIYLSIYLSTYDFVDFDRAVALSTPSMLLPLSAP